MTNLRNSKPLISSSFGVYHDADSDVNPHISHNHAYLQAKKISPKAGLFINNKDCLVIPIYDVAGHLQTIYLQYIAIFLSHNIKL